MSGKTMKLKDLIQELSKLGVTFFSMGQTMTYTARMERKFPIPRHAEINELLAKSILKKAKDF